MNDQENKAKEAEQAGDYISAIDYYSKALDMLKQSDSEVDLQLKWGNLEIKIGDLSTQIGDFATASFNYKDAIAKHKGSSAALDEIFRSIADNFLKIGLCCIPALDYEEALNCFENAIEFLERTIKIQDEEDIISSVEQKALNLALKICCLFNLERPYSEVLPILERAVALAEKYPLEGFMGALTRFFSAAIFKNIKDGYAIFKQEIQKSVDFLPFGSVLQTITMGLIWDFANKFIPQLKVQVKDKEDGEEGEIVLNQQSYEDMLLYGYSYANNQMPSKEYREVIALLIGRIEKNNVIISEIVPMTSGTEKEVEFKEEHYAKAAEINEAAAERNEFIVGWFHTHPNLGLFLSAADIFNQLGYQSLNEKAIALVFDFTQLTPTSSGFGFFRLKDAQFATASYHTVKWRIKDPVKEFYSECLSLFSKFVSTLNHFISKNGELTLTRLADELGRSELLLAEILPSLVKLELLPTAQYDPDTKTLSKSP